MGSHTRVHYMDNLRAFAMLLGIFFHAALAYSPLLNQVWLTADPQTSPLVDMLAYFSHAFRMPLFFIIAGFFGALLVNKRGLGKTVKNRLLRISLPFVIFLPLVLASFAMLIGWAMENIENKSAMLNIISMMAQNPDAPPPPVTTTHLWFLYNLMFFYLLSFIAVKFIKLDWMASVVRSPILFVLFAPLLLVPALATQHAPIPAPEQFMPQLWSFGFYGLFYVLGWGLFKHQELLDKLQRFAPFMLIAGVLAYAVFYSLLPTQISMQDAMISMTTSPELSAKHILMASLEAYIGLYMSLALLVYGRKWLNGHSTTIRLISDSSYWIYIIHLPVLWLLQFLMLDTQWSLLTEFLISSLGTFAIGFITYLIMVRWTPIGWMLNGRKDATKHEEIEKVQVSS